MRTQTEKIDMYQKTKRKLNEIDNLSLELIVCIKCNKGQNSIV